jgi:hypothetical protein
MCRSVITTMKVGEARCEAWFSRRSSSRAQVVVYGRHVAQALVVALGVVVLHEIEHDGAQVMFADRNDVPGAPEVTVGGR